MTLLGVAALVLMVALGGRVAEVDLAKFLGNIGQLTSYLGRIFYLENGQLVFTDIADWYWGFWRWMTGSGTRC